MTDDLRKHWKLLISSDQASLPYLLNQGKKYRFIHYDSDKSIAGRLQSYPLLWQMLDNKEYLFQMM